MQSQNESNIFMNLQARGFYRFRTFQPPLRISFLDLHRIKRSSESDKMRQAKLNQLKPSPD